MILLLRCRRHLHPLLPKTLRFIHLFPHSFLDHFPPESPHHPHFTPPTLPPQDPRRGKPRLLLVPQRDGEPPPPPPHAPPPPPPPPPPSPPPPPLRLRPPPRLPHLLLPDFLDYFHLVPSSNSSDFDLELVRYAMRTGGYEKGARLAFPLQHPRGLEMEKKVMKWVKERQKLPFVSPYEDGSRLPPRNNVSEKWAVGMVHELLSLMVPKKMEKVNLEMVARHVELPAGFRKMVLNHPGIFDASNKLKTQTVVLREVYRRDLLVEKHPLMGLRYQYIHLMRKGKEGSGDDNY